VAGLHDIVDFGTIATAAVVPAIRYSKHWWKSLGWPPLLDGFVDTLRGAALFPCLLVIPAAFHAPLMEILITTKREFVVLAGLYATISVWFSDRWLRDQMLHYYTQGPSSSFVPVRAPNEMAGMASEPANDQTAANTPSTAAKPGG
jgi:hypothetical protein